MLERFNRHLTQMLRPYHFNCAENLDKTLHRFFWLYSHYLPKKAPEHEAPVRALKNWMMKVSDLFAKNVRNYLGPDISQLT